MALIPVRRGIDSAGEIEELGIQTAARPGHRAAASRRRIRWHSLIHGRCGLRFGPRRIGEAEPHRRRIRKDFGRRAKRRGQGLRGRVGGSRIADRDGGGSGDHRGDVGYRIGGEGKKAGAAMPGAVGWGVGVSGRLRGGFGGGGGGWALGLAASAADGDVTEDAALGPVPAAGLAEVPGLREVVVIVVAELGVGRLATGALRRLLLVLRRRPSATAEDAAGKGTEVLHSAGIPKGVQPPRRFQKLPRRWSTDRSIDLRRTGRDQRCVLLGLLLVAVAEEEGVTVLAGVSPSPSPSPSASPRSGSGSSCIVPLPGACPLPSPSFVRLSLVLTYDGRHACPAGLLVAQHA